MKVALVAGSAGQGVMVSALRIQRGLEQMGITCYLITGQQGRTIHQEIFDIMPDVVHCLYAGEASFAAIYAAKRIGSPSVLSLRGNDIGHDEFSGPRFAQIAWSIANCDSLTALSPDLIARSQILVPQAQAKPTYWILNGVDAADFSLASAKIPAETILTTGTEPLLIGTLANPKRPEKGYQLLEYAINRLRYEGHNIALLAIGIPAPTTLPIKDFIYTGPVPHKYILDRMRLCTLAVVPSIEDACPNALLEWMLAEVPVIGTRTGSITRILDNDYVVGTETTEPLYNKLKEMLAKPKEELAKIAEVNRARITYGLTMAHEADQYAEVYKGLIRRSTSDMLTEAWNK